MRVAIIGSGPSAFYVAKYIKQLRKQVFIDLIESQPVPFGLVRFGIAPDHEEVKNVMNEFIGFMHQNIGSVRFFGNVKVGDAVQFDKLKRSYSAVVLATGAQSEKKLNIRGETLDGVLSSYEFVNFYNGHPDFQHVADKLDLRAVEDVTIIGQGNVSLDIARILSKTPASLVTTDISRRFLSILSTSSIRRINVVGRRGPAQAAFTIKELRELTTLPGVAVRIDSRDLELDPISHHTVSVSRPKTRIYELMKKIATSSSASSSSNTIDFRFNRSPVEFVPQVNSNKVAVVRFEVNSLVTEGASSTVAPRGTGLLESVRSQLVITSVGYRTNPISRDLPFDAVRHTYQHVRGRVQLPSITDPGVYVTGWCKRGPTGIIGTNITDARETAETLTSDYAPSNEAIDALCSRPDPVDAIPALKAASVVTWDAYLRIHAEEARQGAAQGAPRLKMLTREEMLRAAAE